MLLFLAGDSLITLELCALVNLRRKKLLLVLQAMQRMQRCINSRDAIERFSIELARCLVFTLYYSMIGVDLFVDIL